MTVEWQTARRIAASRSRRHGPEPVASESVAVESAIGRVLADDVRAVAPVPPYDVSAMDGYAVRGPGPWHQNGRVLAGQRSASPVAVGGCVEIATGAACPIGTDAVLPYEVVSAGREGWITGPCQTHGHIRRTGSDVSRSEVLARRGDRVGGLLAGLMASTGVDVVTVARRPRVALHVTGAELQEVGPPSEGSIRDALGPAVPSLLTWLGAEVVHRARVGDDPAALREQFDGEDVDVHVVTGASSRGPTDHVHDVLAALGARMWVDGVLCRPGHPQLLAELPTGALVVGLPGNPLAAVVGVMTLVAPLLATACGAGRPECQEHLSDAPGRRGDVTVVRPVRREDGGALAWLPGASGTLRSVAHATHLAAIMPHPSESVALLELPRP